MSRTRSLFARLTYANVVATVALVAALGTSGAYAANLIDGKLIKPGTVRTAQLRNGAVTNAKLAPGAVTAKNLAKGLSTAGPAGARGATGATGATGGVGPVGPKGDTGEKGEKGETGTVDTKDFYDKAASDARFAKLDHVKLLGGGTPTENGAALLAAMAAIGTPSGPSDAWLVKLQPGGYDIGAGILQLAPYVDLEGSGVNTTTVSGANTPTVVGASHSEVRDVTVTATTPGDSAVGVLVPTGVTGFSVRDAAVVVTSDGPTVLMGVAVNDSAAAELDHVAITVRATGPLAHAFAVHDWGAVSVRNSSLNASVVTGEGVGLRMKYSATSLVSLRNIVKGSTGAITNDSPAAPVRVVDSQLDAPTTVTGQATCLGSWKADYSPTAANCS